MSRKNFWREMNYIFPAGKFFLCYFQLSNNKLYANFSTLAWINFAKWKGKMERRALPFVCVHILFGTHAAISHYCKFYFRTSRKLYPIFITCNERGENAKILMNSLSISIKNILMRLRRTLQNCRKFYLKFFNVYALWNIHNIFSLNFVECVFVFYI